MFVCIYLLLYSCTSNIDIDTPKTINRYIKKYKKYVKKIDILLDSNMLQADTFDNLTDEYTENMQKYIKFTEETLPTLITCMDEIKETQNEIKTIKQTIADINRIDSEIPKFICKIDKYERKISRLNDYYIIPERRRVSRFQAFLNIFRSQREIERRLNAMSVYNDNVNAQRREQILNAKKLRYYEKKIERYRSFIEYHKIDRKTRQEYLDGVNLETSKYTLSTLIIYKNDKLRELLRLVIEIKILYTTYTALITE